MRTLDYGRRAPSMTWLTSRGALIGVFALATLMTLAFYSGAALSVVIVELLVDALFLILWLLGAFGFGDAILRLMHWGFPRSVRVAASLGLGLGVLSTITLLLGLGGNLNHWTALGIVGAPALYSIQRLYSAREAASGWVRRRAGWGWLTLSLAPLLGIALVAALVPPGILWGDEPNGYDVVEYHLQLPREWFELGKISPLTHNVLSYFPMNVEMNYLLGMHLRGGPWSGMYLAQLMHVAFIALTIFTIYALLADRGPIAIVACVFAGAIPWISLLAPVAYNEGGLLLWGALAIGIALRARDSKDFAIAGAMVGFACGAKLIGAPMILFALPIALALAMPQAAPMKRALVGCSVFVIAGVLTFSPWLIRNLTWTGNPVFPEATAVFGNAHWSEAQVQRWHRANHLPNPKIHSVSDKLGEGWRQIVADPRYAYIAIAIALASGALAHANRESRALVILLALQAIFWLFSTHLQSRFFVLAIPIVALLVGFVSIKWWPAAMAGICILIASFTWYSMNERIVKLPQGGVLGAEELMLLTPLRDTKLSPQDRVVLIGDAKAFWYQVPMNRLSYRTVFDVDAKPGESSVDAWQAGAHSEAKSITVIDPGELARFARTYWMIPPPPPGATAHDQPYLVR